MPPPVDRIRAAIEKTDRDPRTGQVLWRVRTDDGRLDVAYGDQRQPFFVASATKLFVTAILAQLRAEGSLDWDGLIADRLPDLNLAGLFPSESPATVRSVMAHTSGLADYFEGKRPDGPPTFERVLRHDFGWYVRDVVAWTKPMRPGQPGKGRYSDTGYQLLGALIERLEGRAFAESVQARIAAPLGLADTFVFTRDDLPRYDDIAVLRLGDADLRIPLAMASVQADGGIVSTIDDGVAFLDAFFGGRLFPPALHDEIQTDWHRIFSPLEYGTGIMRFRMSPVLTGFRRMPDLVGHSGASGVVMFRAPAAGVTAVGTVNQVQQRSLPYRLMVRTALAAGSRR